MQMRNTMGISLDVNDILVSSQSFHGFPWNIQPHSLKNSSHANLTKKKKNINHTHDANINQYRQCLISGFVSIINHLQVSISYHLHILMVQRTDHFLFSLFSIGKNIGNKLR